MTRSVLVIEDQPAVADSARVALDAAGYDARVLSSVEAALAALILSPPDAVVLDYSLGPGAIHLRLALVRTRARVVLVSGLDDDVARGAGMANGWTFLAKPIEDRQLVEAVDALFPTEHPMPERASLAPAAPAPEPIDAPLPAPPAAPAASDAPLHADPRVAIVDLLSRRILRGVCVITLSILSIYAMTHHLQVDGAIVAGLSALGMGAEAFVAAVKKRPGASAAGAAAILALGVSSGVSGVAELGAVATAGAAALTGLVDWARGA